MKYNVTIQQVQTLGHEIEMDSYSEAKAMQEAEEHFKHHADFPEDANVISIEYNAIRADLIRTPTYDLSYALSNLIRDVNANILALYRKLSTKKGPRVLLGESYEFSIEYSSSGSYSINGLIDREGEGMLMIQSEKGGADYQEQPFVVDLETKLKVLYALEKVAEGTN